MFVIAPHEAHFSDMSFVGDVFYMGRQNGSSLYGFDETSGHNFRKVDNTTFVPDGQKRRSVSMQETFSGLSMAQSLTINMLP